ncbi:hypothetical protein DZB84_20600 [Bacillus sp. HNG]|uniref:hypothetical protein n=1 Tax=Bacillus sp. HNG TaxID=2293325 RepID=UPI000E2FCA84|nr:hypothetical protein [Bacillus sp. HNG]RFB11469.1 hypothetical protein DZB84_20600 [Bacillus sp. HNG]
MNPQGNLRELLVEWEKPISENEFEFEVRDSGIGFAVNLSYGQTYRSVMGWGGSKRHLYRMHV